LGIALWPRTGRVRLGSIDDRPEFSNFSWFSMMFGAGIGMALGYFGYNRKLPLSFRSSLKPLFGNLVEGLLGDIVDIVAILATIIGVCVTIGYGVSQFASGAEQYGSMFLAR